MDINLLESLFKQYVDESLLEIKSSSIQEICDRNYIEYQGEICSSQVESMLDKKIKELVKRKGLLPIGDFRKLRTQLLLKHFINKEPLNTYSEYYSFIDAYSDTEVILPELSNKEEWKELLVAIIDYKMLSGKSYLSLSLSIKEKNEGDASLFWIHRGYNIKVSNGKIDISDEEYKRIGDEVERRLKKLGGQIVIECLLKKYLFSHY